jgi:hypothetical protein
MTDKTTMIQKMKAISFIGSLLILASFGTANAQQKNQFGIDIETPYVESHKRVVAFASAYADKIDIGDPFWRYCQIKLTMYTSHQIKDGLPPFGVAPRDIRTNGEMERIIDQSEVFGKSYLVLCLADAKRRLRQGSLTLYTTGHCKPAPDRLTAHCATVHS